MMNRKIFQTCCFLLSLCYGIQAQSSWEISATGIQPENYYGVTVANGMVGMVSSPEPLQVKDVILNGVYDYYQRGRVSNILKAFNHVNLMLDVDQQRISRASIQNYRQTLDMQHAELKTQFEVGDNISVEQRLMSLRHLPYSALSIVTIHAKKAVSITPYSVIEAPDHLRNVENYFWHINRPHATFPLLTSTADSPSGALQVAASNTFLFPEGEHEQHPAVIHEEWDFNRHWAKFTKNLKAGESYTFAVVSSTCASTDYKDPHGEAERLTVFAALEGLDRLVKGHRQAWEKLWESNVFVEGDPALERDIRFALYHLYSFARAGTANSLSPMGLSGLGYNGHVFWDTELWMYPPLLAMQPDIARSLLEYRYQRLDAALQNAFAHGFKGAMFPWESAADGSEDTPVWALTGMFEHHISGCIAWAAWKYYQVTADREWLETRGWPILKNVADFWASRVSRDGPGQYNINNVIGANEWLENIDNNAFTNAIAILSLRYADAAAGALGKSADPDWLHVADNIPILRFPDGTTRENATYEGETIKQADVVLLSYPLDLVREPARVKQNLDYYTPRTSANGPAMGAAISAVLYNRLGETEKAGQLFQQSYKPNEVPPFGVIAETAGGTNPYFATGAGGMLQAVIFGFGGLEITDKGLVQLPGSIPASWKKLTLTGLGTARKTITVSH
ncbi:MAG: glycoside hydrolase family 65 protein [Saprospiraceae bacterium]|nr:glycoside hydrolase family 65 protein [Saprospiraceae bacterium]